MAITRAERLKTHWFSLALAAILLLAAVAKYRHGFIPIEAIDLKMPYVCTRAWMAGLDPYDTDVLLRLFGEAGGDISKLNVKYLPPVYPPITFIVMTPLALLPWDLAVWAWTIAVPIMVGLLVWALMMLAGLRWRDPRTWLLVLFCIVFSPLRSAVTLAQNALPAVVLVMLAAVAAARQRERLAGVLVALAIGFKMQDGFFVLLYFVLTLHWRAVVWGVGTLAVMSLIALIVPRADPRWVFGMLHWIHEGSRVGEIIDPSGANRARFQMIHLPVLLFSAIQDPRIVSAVNWVVCGMLGLFTCVQISRDPGTRPPHSPRLLGLGALGVVSLLPLYHRFPDAIILILPMAWACASLGTKYERYAQVILCLLLPFLLQPYEILRGFVDAGRISRATYTAWWFQFFVRSILIWLILLMVAWLNYLMRIENKVRPTAQLR